MKHTLEDDEEEITEKNGASVGVKAKNAWLNFTEPNLSVFGKFINFYQIERSWHISNKTQSISSLRFRLKWDEQNNL